MVVAIIDWAERVVGRVIAVRCDGDGYAAEKYSMLRGFVNGGGIYKRSSKFGVGMKEGGPRYNVSSAR